MAKRSTSICLLVVAVLAATISATSYLLAPPPSSSSRPRTKCRISYADLEALDKAESPIQEACLKEPSIDGDDCVSKCVLEKYGFLGKKGRIIGKAVDDHFMKHTNVTASVRKEVVTIFENCAVDAEKEIKQLKSNGAALTECKYEGLLYSCVKRGDNIFKNVPKNCSANKDE